VADKSLVFNILAKDKASREFEKVGGAAENAGRKGEKFGKLLAGAAVAGVGALAAVVKTGFGELQDYQAGFAQTQSVIKSTGSAAGVSAAHVEDLASKIQGYSGQTDDAIVSGQNMLLTFTNIKNGVGAGNDIFDQTTSIMADMSQAMGQDTTTSAKQLGKALNNPIKGVSALQKVGVTFSDSQKATIKRLQETGDVAGAQKVILAELTKEFGGSAKAFGDSGPGQIAKAKRSFEDVSQNVATALLPVLTNLMKLINDKLIPAFKTATDFVIKHKSVIVPLAAVLGTLAGAVYLIITAQKIWIAVQTAWNIVMLANPLGLIIAGIAALVAGVIIAYKHSATFRTIVQGAFKAVTTAFQVLWDVIKAGFNWIKDHWKLILAILTGPIGAAVIFITSHWDTIVSTVKALPGRISSAASGMWDGIKNAFRSAINWIIDKWNGLEFKIPSVNTHIPGVGHVGGFSLGTPNIPRLAQGGIIPATPGGRLIIAGEGGRDEEIRPLGRGSRSDPPQVHVHFHGPVLGGSKRVAEELVDDMMAAMRSRQRRGGVGPIPRSA
jgi:phage-related protein